MRRSQRIREKRLKLLYSLPDNESDSENEGDQGAKLELAGLKSTEDANKGCDEEEFGSENGCSDEELEFQSEEQSERELEDIQESSSEENIVDDSDEDGWESDEDGWNHKTDILDVLNLSFENNGCMIGDVGDKEIDFFKKIFDDVVISKIIEETNIYARQTNSKNWTDLTSDELKAYVGCQIIMGIHKLPNLKLYWSSDPMLRVDAVADTMTSRRFEKITQNLHLNNNETAFPKNHEEYDKLHKLRPLIELLNQNIGKVYRPSSFVTVDESMILFKGRCVLKQYMPLKPIKRGYKVWCIADATTGFILAFIIYTGKEKIMSESTLGERVVMNLARKVRPGSIVVVDNFFTSYSLFDNLRKNGILAVGTVRSTSKGLPAFMRKTKPNKKISNSMNRGEFQFGVKNGISAVQWKDRKPVNFLSSANTPRQTTTVLRRLKNGKRISVNCPSVVELYNKYMGGVDRFDQFRERYELGRKSVKWWFRILYFLLDLAIVNSYILWKIYNQNTSKKNQLTYRLKLARQLIDGFTSRKQLGRPPNFLKTSVPVEVRLAKGTAHLPRKVDTYRRCKYCSSNYKKQTRTRFICTFCKVPLCTNKCFEKFHNK